MASVAILGPEIWSWKAEIFVQLQHSENYIKPIFICVVPMEAGHIFALKN